MKKTIYVMFMLISLSLPILHAQGKKSAQEITTQWMKQENKKSYELFESVDKELKRRSSQAEASHGLLRIFKPAKYLIGRAANIAEARVLNIPGKKGFYGGEYILEKLTKIEINNNRLVLADYQINSSYNTVLYSVANGKATELVGSFGMNDGVRLLTLGKEVPVFVHVGKFGGGSGSSHTFYVLDQNFLKQVLFCPIWATGGIDFIDYDHEGNTKIMCSTRINHPKS